MKRAPLFLLLICVGCPTEREKPKFDSIGEPSGVMGGPGAGAGSGGSGLTSVTVGAATTGSSSSTGTPMIPDCQCIVEVSTSLGSQACKDCVVAAQAGVCAALFQACANNNNCSANLTTLCPNIADTDAAVSVCLQAQDGSADLANYFECICSDPGLCFAECHGQTDCGAMPTSSSSTGP